MTAATTTGPVRLLPRREVLKLIGVSHNTLHLWIEAGQFPRGRPLNPWARYPRLGWREDEVIQWIDALQPGKGRGPAVPVYRRIREQAEARAKAPVAAANSTTPRPTTSRPLLLPKAQRGKAK
jgi:predicted DNA-binding transcriptional regulator AlpA